MLDLWSSEFDNKRFVGFGPMNKLAGIYDSFIIFFFLSSWMMNMINRSHIKLVEKKYETDTISSSKEIWNNNEADFTTTNSWFFHLELTGLKRHQHTTKYLKADVTMIVLGMTCDHDLWPLEPRKTLWTKISPELFVFLVLRKGRKLDLSYWLICVLKWTWLYGNDLVIFYPKYSVTKN